MCVNTMVFTRPMRAGKSGREHGADGGGGEAEPRQSQSQQHAGHAGGQRAQEGGSIDQAAVVHGRRSPGILVMFSTFL